VGTAPAAVTVLPDGSRAYVANSGSGTVSVISSLSNSVSRTITVGADPTHIAASSDSSKVAVLKAGANSVTTINTANDTVSVTLNLAANTTPTYLLVAP
jgi:YVTN family beta-propeller protein